MAKYNDIANELRNRIRKGIYTPNEPLPSQKMLAEQFTTSRMTMQKALDILTSEGLIQGKRGLGTYVSPDASKIVDSETSIDQYSGGTEGASVQQKLTSEPIKFVIQYPNEEVRRGLQLGKNDLVYQIVRLRILDRVPASIEHTYMPVSVIPGLNEEILTHSIYAYIRQELGLKIGAAFRQIIADRPDELDQQYLNCTREDPILQVKQTVYLSDQRPFEYSRTRHRFDTTKITAYVNTNMD